MIEITLAHIPQRIQYRSHNSRFRYKMYWDVTPAGWDQSIFDYPCHFHVVGLMTVVEDPFRSGEPS